jgi:hypothetical protein
MMTKRPIVCLLLIVTFLSSNTYADTFEFLTYKPPTGWMKQGAQEGTMYRRSVGVGLVYFYPSYASTGSSADEFSKMWRARVEPTLPGAAPRPKIQRDGDYSVAVGLKQVDTKAVTTIALVAIVGRGRAIGVLTMAEGNEALREVTTFLDTLSVNPEAAAATQTAAGIEVDFDVPKGYTSQRDPAGPVVLKPTSIDRNTPCIYGISPSRPSSGVLERDARASLLEALPGWQVKGEQYGATRGVAGAGWPYFWFRTGVQQMSGGTMQYLTAMSMAFPAAPGRVNILWGFGPTQHCTLDDVAFLRLFQSLRPRGWTSDGGTALTQELLGTWRNTEAVGMAQYIFRPNGIYEYGQGTSTTFSTRETRTGSVGDGSYTLRGSELTLTGRRAGRHLVRIYEEFSGGIWLKTMSILNESANPPLEVRYLRVKE